MLFYCDSWTDFLWLFNSSIFQNSTPYRFPRLWRRWLLLLLSSYLSEFQYSSRNNVFVMEELKWVLIQPADTTWTSFLNMCAGSQSNVAGKHHFKPKRIENPNNLKFLNYYLMAQLRGWRYWPPVSQSTNSISFILCPPHHPYFFLIFCHNGNSLESKLDQCLLKQWRLNCKSQFLRPPRCGLHRLKCN